MIRGRFVHDENELSKVYEIRRKVLQDDKEKIDDVSVHALLFDEKEKAVATGRIVYDGDTYQISKIAVLEEERKKGYGEFMVKMLIEKAMRSGAREVSVDSKVETIGFYKKIGFTQNEEIDIQNNIEYRKMKINIEDICKNCKL